MTPLRSVEVGQLVEPARLPGGQRLLRHEVLQRVVIRADADDERLPALQVGAPVAQHVDDREHLPIVGRVASLRIVQLVRGVGDRLQSVAGVLLEHGACGKV